MNPARLRHGRLVAHSSSAVMDEHWGVDSHPFAKSAKGWASLRIEFLSTCPTTRLQKPNFSVADHPLSIQPVSAPRLYSF